METHRNVIPTSGTGTDVRETATSGFDFSSRRKQDFCCEKIDLWPCDLCDVCVFCENFLCVHFLHFNIGVRVHVCRRHMPVRQSNRKRRAPKKLTQSPVRKRKKTGKRYVKIAKRPKKRPHGNFTSERTIRQAVNKRIQPLLEATAKARHVVRLLLSTLHLYIFTSQILFAGANMPNQSANDGTDVV